MPPPIVNNIVKVTDTKGNRSLNIDLINSRFAFAKTNIIGIEIDKDSNSASVKFDSAEGKYFFC